MVLFMKAGPSMHYTGKRYSEARVLRPPTGRRRIHYMPYGSMIAAGRFKRHSGSNAAWAAISTATLVFVQKSGK